MSAATSPIQFAQKYRPTKFADYRVGRETVSVIEQLTQLDMLHVILYGPPTSGKTTLINTIIQEYYAGYSEYERENNILYINNLKEQGINFYRNDVKVFCQTSSNIRGKRKMIVIDDIDMINEQSQHVFRNFIDKYHGTVFFIVTCTVIQKVIENLQSRLKIIRILPHQPDELAAFVDHIQTQEGLQITDDAKAFVMELADNSIQLLVHYMEKFFILGEPITAEIAQDLCFNISFHVFERFVAVAREGALQPALEYIYSIQSRGYSVIDILDTFFIYCKISLLLNESEKFEIVELICKYITIFYNIHEDEIELSFFTNNLIRILSHGRVQNGILN